jgi:hypothetical protein
MAVRGASVSDLLVELAVSGIVRPAALRAALGGISPQTLGRLIASAGEDVFRTGRGPSTQYARTRSIEGLGRTIPAFRVDEEGRVNAAGTFQLLANGQTAWVQAKTRLFQGLPPELADMSPQGFVGHTFSARFPELGLPRRVTDWSDDHRLIALARRGEDCVGDLVIGDESLRRFLDDRGEELSPDRYPSLAVRSATESVGSSAGGERPKFGVLSGGRHVLVKYASAAHDGAAHRWRDLLWCEWKALEVVAAAGRPASRARLLEMAGWRFLEAERFDRIASRGRRAVLSLFALNGEHLGTPSTWTAAAPLLRARFGLPDEDVRALRWLDVFGQLIGNTDRHFGNVAFFGASDGALRLAPAYDMLPMILAPAGDVVVARTFEPEPPTAGTLDVWPDAAAWAARYWTAVAAHQELEAAVRTFADAAATSIAALAERVGRARGPTTGRP